jgi:uncharacterized membrane protein HdeD (DUF308 family)
MRPSEHHEERAGALDLAMASGWAVAMFVGIVTVALGVILLAWPGETLRVLSILFGLQLLVLGLFRLVNAFSSTTSSPAVVGFIGIIAMLAGVLVIRRPFDTVTILATILGLVWIVGGSIDLISAAADRSLSDRRLVALSGLVSLIAGLLIVSWPGPTVAVVAVVGGLYLVIIGLVIAATALTVRSAELSGAAG